MLSIIIPARNAASTIEKTIEDYIAYFTGVYGQDFEILVIPNECSDNTVDIVERYCERHRFVKNKVFEASIGKGGAILEGFKLAQGDVIAFVDADGATGPEELHRLTQDIGEYQVVIASRWLPGARILTKQSPARRIASRGFNLLVRLLLGLPFRDTQCGAKVFTKQAVDDVLGELETPRFAFDVDLLYKLKMRGYNIAEVPTVWENKPQSTLSLRKVPFEMFLSIVKLRLLNSPLRRILTR